MSGGMWSLPLSNKIFFTFFLSIIAVAVGLGFLNYYERTGISSQKVIRYYCGDEEEDFNTYPPAEGYQSSIMEQGLFFPKTYRELLEVTHTHIFSIPIIIFILSRIMAMTHTREGLKIIIYSISFLGVILNLVSPWVIRYAWPSFAFVFLTSHVLLIFSFGAYVFIPMYEMWFRKNHQII